MKKRETAQYFTDDAGRRLVRVPVTGSDRGFVTEAALYDNACRSGRLTGQPFISVTGRHRYVYVWRNDKPSNTTLIRLLLDVPPSFQVRYHDGDTLCGLPENLQLTSSWADETTAAEVLDQLLTVARKPTGDESQANRAGQDNV